MDLKVDLRGISKRVFDNDESVLSDISNLDLRSRLTVLLDILWDSNERDWCDSNKVLSTLKRNNTEDFKIIKSLHELAKNKNFFNLFELENIYYLIDEYSNEKISGLTHLQKVFNIKDMILNS